MSYRADYNGIITMWEDRKIITPVLKQILSEYKVAFETSSVPSIDDLILHRLIKFSKNEGTAGYCGLYCYVFNTSQISEIIKFIKPYRTITVQHNGGFITLGIDMNYEDENGKLFKPSLMFFRQDDIGWVRSIFAQHDIEPIEYGYMIFSGAERQQSIIYESSDEFMESSETSLPVSITWAINAGDLICAILNNDDLRRVEHTNKLDELSGSDGTETYSMVERLEEIRQEREEEEDE